MTTVEDLANRLHSAAIHILRSVRVHDAGTGVSAARLSALSVIVYGGDVTMSRLATAEQVRLPTISRLVSGMEHDGLVIRKPDANDRRIVQVAATDNGRALLRRGRALRLTALAQVMSNCSAQEREQLAQALPILERLFGPAAEMP